MSSLFRIKICGITSVRDAQQAARVGADAIGLNFFEQSPRYIEPDRAAEIAASLEPAVCRVGVFVNASPAVIMQTVQRVGLNIAQLHGDESPSELTAVAGVSLIKVFRGPDVTVQSVLDYLAICRSLGVKLAGVMLDGAGAGQYGGTGHTANWGVAAEYAKLPDGPPLILAGGLSAENVADAIAAVHPWGVDTASGVESSPGHKDPDKVARFVAAAREAFEKTAAT